MNSSKLVLIHRLSPAVSLSVSNNYLTFRTQFSHYTVFHLIATFFSVSSIVFNARLPIAVMIISFCLWLLCFVNFILVLL